MSLRFLRSMFQVSMETPRSGGLLRNSFIKYLDQKGHWGYQNWRTLCFFPPHVCIFVLMFGLGVKAWNYVTSMVPNLWLFIHLLWLHSVKCGWIRPLGAVQCWHSHKTLGSFQSSSGFWYFPVSLCCWKYAGEVFHWMVFPPVPRPGDYHALCYDTLVFINREQLLAVWRCCCVLSEHKNRLLL